MRPLRVRESHDDNNTDTSSSDSMQQLDNYLESATSRLSLQSANNQNSSTLRRSNRSRVEDQENRPPAARPQQTPRQNAGGGQAAAGAPTTRRRKQRTPVSRANRMNREIRRLQASTTPLIPRLPFSRLVRELIMKCSEYSTSCRISESALQALQESAELYLTQRFEDAYMLTLHRGRVTLEVRDMALIAHLMKNFRITYLS